MLAGKKQQTPTVWVQYKDGFEVEIRYMPREKARALRDRCRVQKWKNHQMVDDLDHEKYSAVVAEEVVVNWKGCTGEILKKMVLLDQYPEDLPYSIDDCAWLLSEAYDFDVWVQQVCGEVELFEASRRAVDRKNSSPSPASN